MAHHMGEDIWYLLNIFNGMGYMVLFVLALIWLRFLLKVAEDALAPLRKRTHRFVHPLPVSPNVPVTDPCRNASQPGIDREPAPVQEKERLCA